MTSLRRLYLAGLAFACFIGLTRAETYTYPQLVARITDLQGLAKLPQPGETTELASSYDRDCLYDAANDKYIKWDQRAGSPGVVRQEGNESVLMDVQGPGCIWRMTAWPGKGHVKIFLDAAATATVDLPFSDYFSGKVAPFNRPNLVYEVPDPKNARHFYAENNYTPIPFQKSCKIVADAGWGRSYEFTYSRFPAGTVVPTFQTNLAPEDAAALDKADSILGAAGTPPVAAAGENTDTLDVSAE